ncbi:MAG: peptidoglycan-binding protein [Bacillota bacterium]
MKKWLKKVFLWGGTSLVFGAVGYILGAATPLVSWGTRGDLVLQTQQKLQQLGYYRLIPDGIYGEKTYEAIMAFQRATGLRADGIAGPDTLLYLGITPTGTPSQTPSTAIRTTESELFALASIIHGEARGEPYEGQVAVGKSVILR